MTDIPKTDPAARCNIASNFVQKTTAQNLRYIRYKRNHRL